MHRAGQQPHLGPQSISTCGATATSHSPVTVETEALGDLLN
jgi:hypothetical protein